MPSGGGIHSISSQWQSTLCSHAAVKLAEVVGRPDQRLDEVPVAFVELRASAALEPEELFSYCKVRIASYKLHRAIYFVGPKEWPTSATKFEKRVLREHFLILE